MNMKSEFEGKQQHALDLLSEASARLHRRQWWLASIKTRDAAQELTAMIAALQAIKEVTEGAMLICDSLADEKRIEGERAIMQQIANGEVDEITLQGGAENG